MQIGSGGGDNCFPKPLQPSRRLTMNWVGQQRLWTVWNFKQPKRPQMLYTEPPLNVRKLLRLDKAMQTIRGRNADQTDRTR